MLNEFKSKYVTPEQAVKAVQSGDWVDYRRSKNSDELRNLFNPSKNMMKGNDVLHSTEYLICKQIIREHDEYGGKRGCRIYAEPLSDREGFVLCFSLPHWY